ncbi:unnamed protein product [Cylindrotheca closterium]|uniref:Uncharacterized protein n=1 Tax=Cylindrotheca closterium TaxID=2856 RepID=A0AAD2CEI6_9STRA|nr:unnamed protein product [Cylindrotheca closterium]
MMWLRFLLIASAVFTCSGFQSHRVHNHVTSPFKTSPLFRTQQASGRGNVDHELEKESRLKSFMKRLDTTKAAGLEDVKMAGIISKIHGPITYLALGLLVGLKNRWCFKNPYYWFAMAFFVKWYRARYVFKIPVWDRQPNWNNIITSKEQEKDLKAFTCKKCGSTIFIAKSREFFFEGNTGIGGLGCFTCGAKGADNFVMDRDRIVEDVADVDDYFEYERPLDFVSAAERRKVLKEAGGDENVANELLLAKANAEAGVETPPPEVKAEEAIDAEVEETTVNGSSESEEPEEEPTPKPVEEPEEVTVEMKVEEPKPQPETPKPTEKKKVSEPKKAASDSDDDLDDLGMDDF